MSDLSPLGDDRSTWRASDADREAVAKILSDAASHGMLTFSEYDDRVRSVWTAVTLGELEPLTRDLPPVPSVNPAKNEPVRSSERLYAVMSGFDRKGEWPVPERIDVLAFWGGGTLDFRHARIESSRVTVHVTAIMGGFSIKVPETFGLDMRGTGVMGGFDHRSRVAAPGAPTIVVTGVAFWGGVGVERS